MAPVRKCTACFRPAKGHPGPYGGTKCKNAPLRVNDDEEINQQVISNVEINKEASEIILEVDSDHRRRSIVENLVNNIVKENEVEVFRSVANNVSTFNDVGDKVTGVDKAPVKDFDHLESVVEEHAQVPSLSKGNCDPINEASEDNIEEKDVGYEMHDCSLGEASLCFDEDSSDEVRRRLASQSDTNVDIRNLIIGRSFVLCVCDNFECECEGEAHFSKSLVGEAGSVENLYMDPVSDFEIDLKPKLMFSKGGWKKKTPNSIKFKVGGVISPTVISSSGEVQLTAKRVVELVKGRKELSTVIRGKLELAIKVGAEYVKRFGNPVKFKDIECNLYMMEEEDVTDADEKDLVFSN